MQFFVIIAWILAVVTSIVTIDLWIHYFIELHEGDMDTETRYTIPMFLGFMTCLDATAIGVLIYAG